MKPYLCVWHSNCQDGFTSAWIVRRALGEENVDFFHAVHQRPPPDVTERHVIFVDFCYKRDVMLELATKARSILVLDHHDTAMKDIDHDGYDLPDSIWSLFALGLSGWGQYATYLDDLVSEQSGRIHHFFDMERSGAGLTWDFFNPGVPRPKLIDHVEDRDLWRFKLPGTREIQANLFSYPYDFELWDQFIGSSLDQKWLEQFKIQGLAIERKHHKDIAELIKVVTRPMKFRAPWIDGPAPADLGFVIVPVANLPYTMVSDAGHLLCERDLYGKAAKDYPADEPARVFVHPFAACYYDGPDGRNFSLRSREGGADVGQIAKLYGGGGHVHSAGFRVSFSDLEQFEP